MSDKTKRVRVSDKESRDLQNICRVAAERFEGWATQFRKLEQMPPVESRKLEDGRVFIGPPTGETAARFAQQFERQAKDAHSFAALFGDCDSFSVAVPDYEDA